MKNTIYDENNLVMCRDTPDMIDISENNIDEFLNDKNAEIEYLEDGTMMRLYYNASVDKWMCATNNKNDANDAYWSSSKSFGDMFWEIIGEEYDNFIRVLDKNFTYFFILMHTENIHIINIKTNLLIYLYSLNNENEDLCKIFPVKLFDFVKAPIKYNHKNHNSFLKKRGLCICYDNKIFYKYDFYFFTRIKIVRGNKPNIVKRFLELMIEDDYKNMNILKKYYKNFKFDDIIDFINNLYNDYIDSHVKHEKTITNVETLKWCKKLHYIYKTFNTKINKKTVIKMLSENSF